jgi:alpha-D-ribose 1-methylphosphonate 5-triphosphate synthase subunit PhnG
VTLAAADAELRAILAVVQPSPTELLSLWPAERHGQLVLVVRADETGAASIAARVRQHDFDAGERALARRVRRIRGDVPVVFMLGGGRVVVVPLRTVV